MLTMLLTTGVRADVSVVLDASVSMCGYWQNEAEQQSGRTAYTALLDALTTTLFSHQNSRVFEHAMESRTDAAARTGRGSLREYLRVDKCPFKGRYTDLSRVLNDERIMSAETVLLITDAILTDNERRSLANSYSRWISDFQKPRRSVADAASGVIGIRSDFNGRYYRETEAGTTAQGSFDLVRFSRPFYVFWWSKGPSHTSVVSKLWEAAQATTSVRGGPPFMRVFSPVQGDEKALGVKLSKVEMVREKEIVRDNLKVLRLASGSRPGGPADNCVKTAAGEGAGTVDITFSPSPSCSNVSGRFELRLGIPSGPGASFTFAPQWSRAESEMTAIREDSKGPPADRRASELAEPLFWRAGSGYYLALPMENREAHYEIDAKFVADSRDVSRAVEGWTARSDLCPGPDLVRVGGRFSCECEQGGRGRDDSGPCTRGDLTRTLNLEELLSGVQKILGASIAEYAGAKIRINIHASRP
ncbi:MAG: hypothetical protein IPJ27_23270 [Candidatus Accumulibacter sp.]|uniref:Uncharacterized protein n=1 Tax=Candidatus Accumulibacter proximus TaxID=2954385 RepID=A0A935Q4I4_9PROT|nr:hypothetical protein [Candidatus Accumulibacter proximus]